MKTVEIIFFHSFLACLPFLVGVVRHEWWVWPLLGLNALIQATVGAYKISLLTKSNDKI